MNTKCTETTGASGVYHEALGLTLGMGASGVCGGT